MIGYNIHGQTVADYPRLKDHLRRVRPDTLVVMDNSDMALELQAMLPETLVIYRRWPDHIESVCSIAADAYTGSDYQRRVVRADAALWMANAASYVPDNRIALYVLNEPQPTALVVEFLLASIDAARVLGRRLVLGNFATGTPEPDDWRGVLRPLLEALPGTEHWLGLHEYFDQFDPERDVTWHIGRFARVWAACDDMDIQRPRVVITEHGADSLTTEYAGWGRGMSPDEYAAAMTWCDRMVYKAAGVRGAAVFCYGGDDTWRPNYGVEDSAALLAMIEDYARGNTMDVQNVTVAVHTAIKQRRSAGLSGEVIGQWEPGTYGLQASEPADIDGYTWRKFIGGDAEWYSATGPVANPAQFAAVTVLAPEPPVDPPEEPPVDPPDDDEAPHEPPADPVMTVAQWHGLLTAWDAVLQSWLETLQMQQAAVDELRAVLHETMNEIAA